MSRLDRSPLSAPTSASSATRCGTGSARRSASCPQIHCVVDDYTLQGLREARARFGELFRAVSATRITQVSQIQGAGDFMRTFRMGSDRKRSVTDAFGRTWDHPNLWLAGPGLFPTIGTANPTLTIAALALRAAPEIAKDLSLGAGTPIATPAPA